MCVYIYIYIYIYIYMVFAEPSYAPLHPMNHTVVAVTTICFKICADVNCCLLDSLNNMRLQL